MNQTVSDIKRPFLDVYKALDVKAQRKAMKGAMRREGNRLKKAAVANLGSSGIGKGTKRSLSSGIYVRTYPDRYGLGFMVSVKPHGKRKGIHLNRQSKEKPVLMWAEDGTRYRKAGRRISSFFGKPFYGQEDTAIRTRRCESRQDEALRFPRQDRAADR